MIAIGIDPGLTGAIAILMEGRIPVVHDMPTAVYSKAGKRALDPYGLATLLKPVKLQDMLRGERVIVFMERVGAMPGQGVVSMFSLGMSYWGVAGVCAGLGLELHLIQPQQWKAHYGLGKEKDMARGLAARIFPDVDLRLKKHHGRAEALLIAKYGMERT